MNAPTVDGLRFRGRYVMLCTVPTITADILVVIT